MRPGATTSTIVQDFLNVAGIVGFALMDGTQLDYFHHLNDSLAPEDKTLFAQNVAQVFATIPTEFFELDLQLQTHWTHLYRLDRAKVFVVWLGNAADRQRYQTVLPPLLQTLKDAPGPALDQLHVLASAAHPIDDGQLELEPMMPSLQMMLSAINQVITAGMEYLGKRILANQVLMTRPSDEWLKQVSLDAQGRLVSTTQIPLQAPLTPAQYASLQRWADAIIQAVRRVIRDFRDILETELSPLDQSLLFEH
jgi:hypothetical protein